MERNAHNLYIDHRPSQGHFCGHSPSQLCHGVHWCHLLLPMVIYYLDRKVRHDQGHLSFYILISSPSLRITDSAKNR